MTSTKRTLYVIAVLAFVIVCKSPIALFFLTLTKSIH